MASKVMYDVETVEGVLEGCWAGEYRCQAVV